MTPQQNYPLWNENFPPTKFSTKVPSYQHNSLHWSVPQQHYPARSLSHQNLTANISSLSNAFDSQLKNLCMGIDKKFNNYWAFKNSHFNADSLDLKYDFQRQNMRNFDSYNYGSSDKDYNCNNSSNWPVTPITGSELIANSEMNRCIRNNLKKPIHHVSGNIKNLEKWPKSLETLPKTPTDVRSKSVMNVDSNLLSNYPVFPCDPMGPTAELNKPSGASGAASGHVYGHKATDRGEFTNLPS